MAEQLAGLGGALQGSIQGALTKGQGFLDSIFPPEKRAELWVRFNKFVTERPKFAVGISISTPMRSTTDVKLNRHSSSLTLPSPASHWGSSSS
jgi:hypothetical protein